MQDYHILAKNWIKKALKFIYSITMQLQPGVEDVVFATLKWSNGVMAHVQVSWLDPGKVRKLTVVGSRKVVPGDVLELHVEATRGKPGAKVWKFAGRAEVEGELACECSFTAMMDIPVEAA